MSLKTLQIGRPLNEPAAFLRWANKTLNPNIAFTNPHSTIAYSRSPVDWTQTIFAPLEGKVIVEPTSFKMKVLAGNVLVLAFESEELEERWRELRNEGASWDFETFQPHITLGKQPTDLVIEDIDVFNLPVVLGPEYRKETKP